MSPKIFFCVVSFSLLLAACGPETPTPSANMPNPAAVFCEENGGTVEIRTDASGGQAGVCIFPDGSGCDEWAYFRGECKPGDLPVMPMPNMPNPAAVFCEENGGTVEIRTDASGGQVGVCIFPDGSECDEWAYFRGECKPGDSLSASKSADAGEVASDGWKVYRNEKLGYSFLYPADAVVEVFEQGQDYYVSVTGPLADNEKWPIILVGHPPREDFRPPDGADLEQWLIDHDLLVEERMPDVTIAGTNAIHTRKTESGQSYPDDRFTFAHVGQIYQITILHTGNKQDWELYNYFLESFQFSD